MSRSDPFAEFIISRKRKKYKFAYFTSYANCFSHARTDNPKIVQKQLKQFFEVPRPLILEIAAGNAQFSYQLAKKYPKYNFIAADIKSDRLYTSAKQALEENVANIAFIRMNMAELDKVFPKHSVETIWLTFPDPFSRKRSQRRRLTHPVFLEKYHKILRKKGDLKFKTDNRELFLWSLEQFVAQDWRIEELSFDLHESNLPDDYKIKTAYETRFMAQDVSINYCRVK